MKPIEARTLLMDKGKDIKDFACFLQKIGDKRPYETIKRQTFQALSKDRKTDVPWYVVLLLGLYLKEE